MRISKITFNADNIKNCEHLNLENVTILVGPHNSGKSQFLRDIESWCWNYPEKLKILKELDLDLPTNVKNIEKLFKDFKIETPPGQQNNPDVMYIKPPFSMVNKAYDKISLEHLKNIFSQKRIQGIKDANLNLIVYFMKRLDAKTRLDLVSDSRRGNMYSYPTNQLDALYRNNLLRKKIRTIINDEFGWFFYLSNLEDENLKIVLSKNPNLNEHNFGEKSIQQFKKSEHIEYFGDGIKCFIGILVAALAYSFRILLVDEPEAFLHPSAAHSLGHHLSSVTKKRHSSLVVATHDANFLMGCLESTKKLTILRLTYNYKDGKVTQLKSQDIKKLYTDPILRSTDSLSTLFHKSAIVCEADKDKVFYKGINDKFLLLKNGIKENIFLNANGKDGIFKLVRPLRRTGVPVACIYDFDVFKTNDKNKNQTRILWKNIFSACNIDKPVADSLEKQRCEIIDQLSGYKNQNIFNNFRNSNINSDLLKSIDSFLRRLYEYGIFVVSRGNLESWLHFSDDQKWLENALHWIEYNKPNIQTDDDSIWSFLLNIKKWINNQARKGMPLI